MIAAVFSGRYDDKLGYDWWHRLHAHAIFSFLPFREGEARFSHIGLASVVVKAPLGLP